LQFEIYGINKIDIKKSSASIKASIREWWTDLSLTWNPSEYGNVRSVKMPSDPMVTGHSWVPDF
jgi:hypothetical protein